MLAFQIVQDITKFFGTYPADRVNYIKVVLFGISKVVTFSASMAYFLFKAKSANEYGQTFYVFVTIMAESACYTAMAVNMTGMTELFRKFHEIVHMSELIFLSETMGFRNITKPQF